jgi:putative ATPase
MKTDRYLSTKNIVLSERSAIETFWWGRKAIKYFELVVNASNEDEILITNDLVFP